LNGGKAQQNKSILFFSLIIQIPSNLFLIRVGTLCIYTTHTDDNDEYELSLF
jgi:hypothetical protein